MNSYSWPEPPRQQAFPIAKPGYALIFAAAFITFVFALLNMAVLAILGIIITLFICWFFRDPNRVTPNGTGMVVSPADGKVIVVKPVEQGPGIDAPCIKISIFMSVFNVHVNRIPYNGTVKHVIYHPGKFLSANLDKASAENEQNAVVITTTDGHEIGFVQIAGLIARRILCDLQSGDKVVRGRRYGMICFGSRLDVYLPGDTTPMVSVGDKVQAGSSVLGTIN